MRKEKQALMRFLTSQGIVTVGLTLMVRLLWDQAAAWSTCLGGLLVIIPNIFLIVYLSVRVDPRHPTQMVRACYIGEAIKIVLIASLLVLMLHFDNVALGPLLLGLIGTYAVYIIAPKLLRS